MKKIIGIILFSALGGIITLGGYKLFFEKPQIVIEKSSNSFLEKPFVNYTNTLTASTENTDFTVAAEKTLNSVVHVKNTSYKTIRNSRAEFFYGLGSGSKKYSQVGTGSGVVISSDGYIITNNHVIKNATEIEITLNNKKQYKAKLIGTDPTNDIALLKIDADDLPYVIFGDSNNVKVGEWVLAVGNPYNLTSTVTAGIISAKGRDLDGTRGVDSFIQTDAAVNPGNSGGALVNIRGELVGINTAISSRTGSFIGYSFAVPSNIAKKVVEDIMEYGNVQKAILGVRGSELNNKMAENLEIENTEGFYISEVTENSGAEKAGLKQHDIIIKINTTKVSTFSDLEGFLRTKRPNDIVNITFLRNGKEMKTNVTLIKNEISKISSIGLELKNLDKQELEKLKILNGGVMITGISNKELLYYGVKKGYIITAINNKEVISVDDVNRIITAKSNSEVLRIEMLNLKGEKERYIFR
ncbi:MAG: trypsin-like peptidase domain-containing protein [Lutibacter sp.]|nr:trypsin-like peptidase domain-containing protein [Lutibacter sp.]